MKKECLVFYLQVEAVEPSEGRLLLFSYANLCFNQPKEAIYIYIYIIHFLLNFNLGDLK